MLPENFRLEIIRSRRKTLAITVREEGVILAKAPLKYPTAEIWRFVETKRDWIEKQFQRLEGMKDSVQLQGSLSEQEIRALAAMAKKVLPERVAHYAKILGVTYGRITIRNQRSLWGSCSASGNLNFNCLLMLAPSEVADYVVVHELCHRLEMNHSQRFWAHVRKVLPDYARQRKWLREEGAVLMKRMTGV